jgi:hypothetical protein
MGRKFNDENELFQCVMVVLSGISCDELEAVFEEWPVRFDTCIQQGGDYAERDDFDKHLFILWSLFHVDMLKSLNWFFI